MSQKNRFAIDFENEYLGLTDTTVIFNGNQAESSYYVLGLLNSLLLNFRFQFIGKLKGNGIYEYFWNSISKLPIRKIDFENTKDKKHHDTVVKLVEHILQLNNEFQKVKTSYKKEVIQRQINATDKQIDKLVYKLYDLTEEEIAIVEEGVN